MSPRRTTNNEQSWISIGENEGDSTSRVPAMEREQRQCAERCGEDAKEMSYLIVLSFERVILGVLGDDFVGAVVVGVDNVGFGHFGVKYGLVA